MTHNETQKGRDIGDRLEIDNVNLVCLMFAYRRSESSELRASGLSNRAKFLSGISME